MILDSYGNRRFYGIYRGIVVSNADPLNKGRVKVQIPQVLANAVTDWAWVKDVNGVRVNPPKVKQGVWVQFEGGDPSFPVLMGTFGDNTNTVKLLLNDLTDVNTAGVTDGQVIKYQASTQTWLPGTGSGGGGGALNDLTDVTVTSVANGNTIVYNSSTGQWVNITTVPAGGTAGQILTKTTGTDYATQWTDNYADWTSQVKQYVRAAEILTKGQAVYVSSSDGTNIMMSKASNTTEALSSKTIGLIAQDLNTTSNKYGYVITEGLLGGLNTSSGEGGDPVWLGVSGELIYGLANKPVSPAHLVYIGVITKKSSGSGEIFIKPQNGFELQELHNVLIGTGYSSTPADNNLLAYDSASSLWKNQTGSQANLVTLSDSGTVTNTMLANSGITFGSTLQALGSTITNIAGVTINSTTIPSSATLLTSATTALPNVTSVNSTTIPSSATLLTSSTSAGGDLTGTYPNPTLAAVGTAGTYSKVTTDSKGRVTSGTSIVTYSTTAPVSPAAGDLWYCTEDGTFYTYYTEVGTASVSSQWVQVQGNSAVDTVLTNRVTTVENTRPLSQNYVINGGFDIWQRGTTAVTTNGNYSADRWIIGSSAGTNSVTQSTDIPTGVGFQYALSFAGTSTTNPLIRQRIEAKNTIALAGQTVTLSFYAKSTSGSAAIKVNTAYPTTTDDTFGTWAAPTTTADQSALAVTPAGNASGSWTRYSVSFTVSSNATRGYQIDLYRESTTTSTTTLFTGVQLELGSIATPFCRNASSIQSELAACQRYYYRAIGLGTQSSFGSGMVNTSTQGLAYIAFPVTMRDAPSATLDTTGTAANYGIYSAALNGALNAVPTSNAAYASTNGGTVSWTVASGATVGQSVLLTGRVSGAYIGFSAEL